MMCGINCNVVDVPIHSVAYVKDSPLFWKLILYMKTTHFAEPYLGIKQSFLNVVCILKSSLVQGII